LSDWKADVLELMQEAAKIAQVSKSRKIAEATAEVVNAMVDDGLVNPTNLNAYALVMNELIASGALRIRITGGAPAIRSPD
jgi:hypothetical protein